MPASSATPTPSASTTSCSATSPTYTFNNGSERKKGTLFQNFGGLVFLIDTGMSRGVDYSHGALLHIEGAKAIVVSADGTEKRVWP